MTRVISHEELLARLANPRAWTVSAAGAPDAALGVDDFIFEMNIQTGECREIITEDAEVANVETVRRKPDKVIVIDPEEKEISPEWLLARGFKQISRADEDFSNKMRDFFGYNENEGDLIFVEKELDRQNFCVILTTTGARRSDDFTESDELFLWNIMVREDIGCGSVEIPGNWCRMTEYHFSLIYEGIRRQKLPIFPQTHLLPPAGDK